jgi:hypothetical protein
MPRPGLMSDEPDLNLQAIELEEARLRERLAKIAAFKQLARELNIPLPGMTAGPSAVPPAPFPNMPIAPEPAPELTSPGPFPWMFDHTFAGLVRTYQAHERSPYRDLKHKVRLNYDNSLSRLVADIGPERIDTWNADSVQRVYTEKWAANGKVSMGHSMIAKLRLLCTFGSTILNDDGCTRLSAILGNMRFPVPKPRAERLLREQARAIRIAAREHFGWDSIALAVAIQFEFPMLKQVDILGEWVPLSEPGTSDIVKEDGKWLQGLRWSDIDDNMVLRRMTTSGRKNQHKLHEFDLKRFAMTMEEINRTAPWRRKGPLVVCEFSGLPWTASEYRRKWRIVADKAGIPANIRSSDSGSEEESEGRVNAL